MALLGNYQLNLRSPCFWHGANSFRSVFNQHGAVRNSYGEFERYNSIPSGGNGWVPAQIGGGLASFTSLEGLITGFAALAAGINIEASLPAQNISTINADLEVIANLASSVSCALSTVDAALASVAALDASITTLLSVNANLGAIVDLGASIPCSGAISTNVVARFYMTAEISSQTELSPQNLAESLWNSVASDYNAPNTMGEKLNDAGSVANPWTEVIEGPLTASDILRLLIAVAAGETQIADLGGGNATVVFKSFDGSKNRVEADLSGSERTLVTVDPTT